MLQNVIDLLQGYNYLGETYLVQTKVVYAEIGHDICHRFFLNAHNNRLFCLMIIGYSVVCMKFWTKLQERSNSFMFARLTAGLR